MWGEGETIVFLDRKGKGENLCYIHKLFPKEHRLSLQLVFLCFLHVFFSKKVTSWGLLFVAHFSLVCIFFKTKGKVLKKKEEKQKTRTKDASALRVSMAETRLTIYCQLEVLKLQERHVENPSNYRDTLTFQTCHF